MRAACFGCTIYCVFIQYSSVPLRATALGTTEALHFLTATTWWRCGHMTRMLGGDMRAKEEQQLLADFRRMSEKEKMIALAFFRQVVQDKQPLLKLVSGGSGSR